MEPVTPSVIRFPKSTGTVVLERMDILLHYTSREIASHGIATFYLERVRASGFESSEIYLGCLKESPRRSRSCTPRIDSPPILIETRKYLGAVPELRLTAE